MSPLVWVLVSSVAWVAADVLRKKLAGPMGAAPLGALLALGSLAVFGPWWLAAGGTATAGYLAPAAGSLLANIVASILLIVALHRGELGLVVPMLALTPALSALSHSMRCSARTPLWRATSDAEHAVSYDTHGPCTPSANDTRPHVTEHAKPVAAYTLKAAVVLASTWPNSLAHWPTLTAMMSPRSDAFERPAVCRAV